MNQRIRVFAPATVANLGPGFDVLGLALSKPGDELEAELSDRPGVEIVEVTGARDALGSKTLYVPVLAGDAALRLLP